MSAPAAIQLPATLKAATPIERFRPTFSKKSLVLLVALLLGETTINYIDRQVVSVLAPVLRAEFSLSNAQYAMILNAFLGTYAVAYAFAGWALDRLGISRGLSVAVTWWSIAGALTALARGPRAWHSSAGCLPSARPERGPPLRKPRPPGFPPKRAPW